MDDSIAPASVDRLPDGSFSLRASDGHETALSPAEFMLFARRVRDLAEGAIKGAPRIERDATGVSLAPAADSLGKHTLSVATALGVLHFRVTDEMVLSAMMALHKAAVKRPSQGELRASKPSLRAVE